MPEETKPEEKKTAEIVLETGQKYTGETWEEVAQKMASAQTEASRAIQDRERQIYEMKQERSKPVVSEGAFDPNMFYEKLGKGEVMEALNYADKFRYGDIDPVEALKYSYAMSRQQSDMQAVAAFHANVPEFPKDVNAATALLKRVESEGLPVTASTLEAGFRQLVREGVLKPVEIEQEHVESRGNRAPKVPTAQKDSISEDFITSFESLSKEDMEKELRKHGMLW